METKQKTIKKRTDKPTGNDQGASEMSSKIIDINTVKPTGIKAFCEQLRYIKTADLPQKKQSEQMATELLNKTYASTIVGAKEVIVKRGLNADGKPETQYLLSSTLKNWGGNLRIPFAYKNPKTEKLERKDCSAITSWYIHPDRETYHGVAFNPAGLKNPDYLNLWQGFITQPDNTKDHPLAQKFLTHLFDNVCNGNQSHYDYLIAWIADIFQNPSKKPGVAVVLRSEGKGTGKSKAGDVIRELIGKNHSTIVSHAKHLTGTFNAHLSNCIFVTVEESFWSGNHADVGVLNHLITGDDITIERKNIDAFSLESFHRFFMATNNDWAVPASYDERRVFVLDVAEHQKQNREYFKALTDDLEAGGYEQLIAFLLNHDYSSIDVGKPPRTEALERQIMESMQLYEQFWCDCLSTGLIGSMELDSARQAKVHVYNQYLDYVKMRGSRAITLSEKKFGRKLKNMCPEIITKNIKVDWNEKRTNGYQFPTLEKSRELFNKAMNIAIDWDD
jgi:hypothetical protein